MKKVLFFCIVLITITIPALTSITPAQSAQPSENPGSYTPIPAAEDILSATIQISIFPAAENSASSANSTGAVYERGLATLVQRDSSFFLVSHDHWTNLEQAGRVEFRDAASELLVELTGAEFNSLIRYQDQGTMLLTAPLQLHPQYQALLASRSEGDSRRPVAAVPLRRVGAVQVGQVVTIAYRSGEGRNQVALLPATIIEIANFDGKPSIRLQSLDGTPILPGDSGGGIWLDGELVGNMWLSEWVYDWRIWTWDSLEPKIQRLATSQSAQIPVEQIFSLASQPENLVEALPTAGFQD
jgi:hypothetical protein